MEDVLFYAPFEKYSMPIDVRVFTLLLSCMLAVSTFIDKKLRFATMNMRACKPDEKKGAQDVEYFQTFPMKSNFPH